MAGSVIVLSGASSIGKGRIKELLLEDKDLNLLFAVSKKIIAKYGVGSDLVSFLKNTLNIQLSAKAEGFLSDEENQIAAYDLLGVLKSSLIERIYIPADDECPDVKVFLDFASRIGAIPAYAYLGDVGDSVYSGSP